APGTCATPAADRPERAATEPAGPAGPARAQPTARRTRPAPDTGPPDQITAAVTEALTRHEGDMEAATAALVKRAIPDAMALLDATRKGGRYDVIAHPWIPDILRKQTARGADQVWEARPKWARPGLPPGCHEVTALDINGAYLSALKTHLPIGQLEHSSGNTHDRRRAGVHLVTPPAWDHDAHLPNPIGNRDEPGPLWITEPTLRLLLRLSGPKYGLCDPPEIHESYTSGATENLLEKFRVALKDARDTAIAEGDEVTLEYVKAMYSKFVSTMGESNYNRELYRPDWMHLIRSQAFANLWMKAYKAYDEGLTPVRVMGTDELHVIGDWRRVFPEGRGVYEVKVKDVYSVGTDPADPAAAGQDDDTDD
ncbi:transcriptional regulator, partial [Streptomyces sp. OfavH-34-F]|nr:transcriptional regulator [Streptomyces sp. OfavH-34-F]